jgi:hypothetical protein
MVLGSPGKIVKQVPEEIKHLIKEGVDEYMKEALKYLESESV